MFEGTKLQVDKLENGYGIKTGEELGGNVRKFVFENFGALVRHLALMFGAEMTTQEVSYHAYGADSGRINARALIERMRGGAEEPPSYDELRDQLGESRQQLKAALLDLKNTSAGLKLISDKYTDLEGRYARQKEEFRVLLQRFDRLAAKKKTPARKS